LRGRDEWWFAVGDVVGVLAGSANPTNYIKKMRKRDPEFLAVFNVFFVPKAMYKVPYSQKQWYIIHAPPLLQSFV
jgi:hypothetical protein